MTLSTLTSRTSYPGTGSTGPFAIPFRFLDEDDLRVTKRSSVGAETPLTAGTHFSTTGAGEATGTLTLVTALASGETLIIRRAPALTQDTSLRNQGAGFRASIEDALDRLGMQIQAQQDELARSVKLSETLAGGASLTELNPEAGKVVTGDGTGFTMSTLDSSAVALPGDGRTVATLSAYLANNAVRNIADYGALPANSATVNAAAIHLAMSKADLAGGGVVLVPAASYPSQEISFGSYANVILEGAASVFNYESLDLGPSILYFTTGVWGVKLPPASHWCALRNLTIQSNGYVDGAVGPHPIVVAGVEYGVVTETHASIMDNVTVYGFQHGCVMASGGNSNVFKQCSFVWNTRTGFAVTVGTAAGYALHHPNLVAPASPIANTRFYLDQCIIRRNVFGAIIREGAPVSSFTLFEANYYTGLLVYQSTADLATSWGLKDGVFDTNWFEGNYSDYNTTTAYTIVGNNLLLDSAGTPMSMVQDNNTALNEYGYQIMLSSQANGGGAGSQRMTFRNTFMSLTTPSGGTKQKAIYDKSSTLTKFFRGRCDSSDANSIRLGNGAWLATATHFEDFSCTQPATWSNRCTWSYSDTADTLGTGGTTMSQGYFRGLQGNVKGPAIFGTLAADSIGFYGTTPIAQQVFATGTGKTVDQLITALQNLGLLKQS